MQSRDEVTSCSSCVAAPIPDGASGRYRAAASRQGETLADAVVRELREETGLEATCGAFVGWVERIGVGYHFVILDFEVDAAVESPSPATTPTRLDGWRSARSTTTRSWTGLADFLRDRGVIEPR